MNIFKTENLKRIAGYLCRMSLMLPVGVLTAFTSFTQDAFSQPLQLSDLRCEYRHEPLNIDAQNPRLSWIITTIRHGAMQTACEVIVGTGIDGPNITGIVWESGKMATDKSANVPYSGKTLQSCKRYYWKVRIQDERHQWTGWSRPTWFETSFIDPGKWNAQWIGDDRPQFQKDEDFYQDDPMPVFKKVFHPRHKLISARLYITGLGYYEFMLNGKSITSNKLDPGFTSYRSQVLYNTYDITPGLLSGNNVLTVMLGNGWWNPLPLRLFRVYNLRDIQQTGRPCLKASVHLCYTDGSEEWINSDRDWRTTQGPVIRNSVYLGEKYDARREIANLQSTDYKGWERATLVLGPSGVLTAEAQPPVKVTRILHPESIKKISKDTFIVDMGQNFAGVVRLFVQGKRGTEVRIKYGEDLFPNGRLNYLTTVAGHIKEIWHLSGGPGAPKTAWQQDIYILKGGARESWSPKFTFHSFRYLEITGWPGKLTKENIEGLRMNADLEPNGTFSCSNEFLNQLHRVIQWTFLSNVFSIQSDCPGREKMGYGGDMVATANAFMFNYNMSQFYRKTVQDFANDQQKDGAITEIAPYTGIADHGYGGQSGPLGWELAFPYLQSQLLDFYGDTDIVKKNYQHLNDQMTFLAGKADSFLFYRDISDHEAIDPKPEAFSASAFYYHHAVLAARFAALCGKPEDQRQFEILADSIRSRIRTKFQRGNGIFSGGTESAQAIALWYDLPSSKNVAFDQLMQAIKEKKEHIATGIFGTKMLFDVLRRSHSNDVAYEIATQKSFPGWGFMLANQATTLWESWTKPDNATSQNHPMFGSVDEWMYRSILGINPLAPGFKKIEINPQPAGDLAWAKGSYKTIYGEINVYWRRADHKFFIHVSLPANTENILTIPTTGPGQLFTIAADGKPVLIKGTTKTADGQVSFKLGSGVYDFYTPFD